MKRASLLSFLLVNIFITTVFAYTSSYTVKRLGIEDGLSSNYVLDMVQDRKGYIWVATTYGLNRFDGKEFRVYDQNNSCLNGSGLHVLMADPVEDKVWIGTYSGLYCFDYGTESILPWTTSLSDREIRSLTPASDYGIWITHAMGGIEHYLPGQKETVVYSSQNVRGLEGKFNTALDDGKGNLYIGHVDKGLSVVSLKNRTCTNYRHIPGDPNTLPGNTVYTIYMDSSRNIWVGTNQGLALFNPQKERFTSFKHVEGDAHSLPANQVVNIRQVADGTLWICTYMGGVSLLNLQENTFTAPQDIRFRNITAGCCDGNGLSGPNAQCVMQDSFGNIWVGNYRGGIDFISYAQPIFGTVTYTEAGQENVGNKQVWGLLVDTNNRIWLGGEGRLGVYEKGKAMDIIPLDRCGLNPKTHINVMLQDKHRNIWLGTHQNGIALYNMTDKRIERIGGVNTLNVDVCCFYEDTDGKIWIGTQSGIYSYKDKKLTYEEQISSLLPDKMVRGIVRDKNGKLWIGTKGVVILDAGDRLFRSFTADKKFPAGSVNYLMEDARQRIWVGACEGLIRFNDTGHPENYTFYGIREGLNNTNVRAIQEDHDGTIWLSTNAGISRLDENSSKFYHYNHFDGVPMGDFMDGSTCLLSDGTLYFGSQSGACYFDPREVLSVREISPATITRFSIYNKQTENKDNELPVLVTSGKIRLLHDRNTFKIAFNVLDYTQSPQAEFAYMLEGLDNKWYNTQGEKHIIFHNIPPGNYTFKVKARLRNQPWDERMATLDIHIVPPFWLTWYAKLIYLLLFLLVLYRALRFYKRKLNLENTLELERKKGQNEQELNDERLRFYTNITHELRTPLTLILGPLEDLLNDAIFYPKHASKISIIYDNAVRLLNLINRILEFRKTETRNRKLSVDRRDIAGLIREVGLHYKELNRNQNVNYTISIETEETELFFDPDTLTLILNNLMSNAVKYTVEGEIVLSLRSLEENQIKYTEISVSDTGCGIDPEVLPYVFDRYYQAKGKFQTSGSGIGLALVKGLAELHEAILLVDSILGVGTTFTLRLLTEHVYPDAIHMQRTADEKQETEEETEANVRTEVRLLVLIVEDDADISEYIRSSLADVYEVVIAKDGKEGWELAQIRIPNAIVSDIMMPVMDGIELCKRIKEDMRTSHIPVILLTAKDSMQDKEEGYASGADSYLTKPFSARLLRSRIDNLLENRRKIASLLVSNTLIKQENAVNALNKLDNEFLRKLTQIIEENLDMDKMDIAFIAEKMCMSHSTLYRKIKGLTDMSANEFIRKVKIRNGMKLLLSKEYTISEIAYMTGFNSVAYFRQCFKDEYGTAPSDYMKQNQ